MTLASTWLDLVVGVDVHMHLVPTPAGPVPTPIPQPFVGMVGDPVSEIVGALSGTLVSLVTGGPVSLPRGPVLINGIPATTTSSAAKNAPVMPHLPMPPGTAHVKPPAGEATFPMGALKISFGGASSIRMGDLALSCADPVAMPTSRVVAIPKGPPVMVDGAPGFSLEKAVAGWAFGKLIRTAFRGVASVARAAAARLSGPRLRNLVSKGACFVTGHPVDVATGRVFTDAVDFSMPGAIPLVFERSYFSSWSHREGPLGRGWSHALDLGLWFEDDLAVFRNAEGQEIVFVLPDGGRRLEVDEELFDPLGGDTLSRKRDGWYVTTAAGLVHRFAVSGDVLRLARTTRRNPDVGVDYAYDDAGRLTSVTDCAGRVLRLEHGRDGRLARLLGPDPAGDGQWVAVAEYAYSPEGLLAEVRDALGNATRYEYDGGLMVKETDRNGVSFFWMYDGRGSRARCVRTWGLPAGQSGGQAGGQVIYNQKIDYDPAGRTTLVTDSYDAKTLYKMNALGAVVEIVDPLGGKTAREYDDALRVTAEVDALGNRTTHHYGARGQLLSTVYPDGARVMTKYDPRCPELPTLRTTEIGATWRYRYDGAGQLVEVRGPEADAWRRYEWERGAVAAVIEASGARTQVVERDRWGNPVLVRLPNGAEVRRRYDARGRCVSTTNPYGATQTIRHDAADRVVGVGEPDGNVRVISRDAMGNVVEIADRQRRVRMSYANFNKLASRQEDAGGGGGGGRVGDGDGDGDTVRFVWGAEGELREIRNEKNQDYRFVYDPCLRLEREIGFDLQETVYRRNPAGWVTKIDKPKAGAWTSFAHDPLGRVVAVEHAGGASSRFAYRKDGELVEATNQTVAVTFARDALGRVTRETQGDVEVSSFHAGGLRARLQSSLGAELALARDDFGNPTSISLGPRGPEPQLVLEHDAAGLEARRTMPGGVSSAWTRDPAGRPVRHDVAAPAAAGFTREYAWAFDDRITRIADTRFGLSEYQHDPRGRLVAERRGAEVTHRSFDAVGNVYRTPDHADRRYVRGGILRHDRGTTFKFDPLGNLVERVEPAPASGGAASAAPRTWTYAWDGAGMLSKVTRPDGLEVTFAYDALGRRVSKRSRDVETRWIWDGDVILHELRSDRPPTTWYHEPESFTPLARSTAGRFDYVVADHIGTPIALFGEGGAAISQIQRDVFGAATTESVGSEGALPIGWPGQYADEETGLSYNRFRYYDAELGVYISQDPIGVEGGLVAYGYVSSSLCWVDPWGLEQLLISGLVYRGGSDSTRNYSPRSDQDTAGPKRGLSTFQSPERAFGRTGRKAQVIDVSKLGPNLEAVLNDDAGHVSIRPKKDPSGAKLLAWAALRDAENAPNPLADEVRAARTGEVRRQC